MEIGISISSVYTKRTLMKAHPNISVLRHPDAVRGGPLLWSHHEKLVVIDQKYAFVGGIDLCFGRWDNYEHRLTDLGGIGYKNADDTLVIHNSTKPTGLTYRSVSQPILTPPAESPLKVEKSLDGHLLVPGSSSPASQPMLFAQGVKSSSTTRLITVHTLNTTATPETNPEEEEEEEVEDDRIEEEDEQAFEKSGDSKDKDFQNQSPPPQTPQTPQSLQNPPQPPLERKYRTRLGMGNMRHRISTKIRNKRIAAISKFRKINRRLRGAASGVSGGVGSLRKSSDAGLDNISYISSDLIENHPDFFKQQIPRLRAARGMNGIKGDVSGGDDDDDDEHQVVAEQLEGAAKLWIGKDYTNFIVKDFSQLEQPFQDAVDRHTTPRMPWHDVSCMVVGAAARDVARHFIQRWNHAKYSKVKFNDRYPWLIPKSYANVEQTPVPSFLLRTHPVTVQVLRSVSAWSAGVKRTEASIVDAYIEAISNADHYIYIENQFFISQTKTHTESGVDVVKNRIAEALYRRIIRAHRNGQTFRVYILIPLLPAFEGEIGTSSGFNIQQITHYNYATITKGPHSLLGKLRAEIDDPSRYIGFYSLRSWGELNGRLVTELTYIHSKILIADDHLAIIGSANINDRSMLGSRDSEVAVIIEDEEFDTSYLMNGKPYRSGRFAGSLRRMLMREHLGIYNQE
ncbi:PREDICTED: phospholipase D1-like, partial [Rhagoletis zephyria]|uniref:phospholipase D1-like n=1 Tax=Rhagoletis zephyria TaxID=28612 RepID=UPI000811739A